MVEVFSQLASKWSKWCAQTLHPFSQSLTISSRIGAPIVAPPSENFWKMFNSLERAFLPQKSCKPNLNRPTNTDVMCCGNNSTTHQSGRRPTSVIYKQKKQSEKNHISSSHADVRHAIYKKFCMVIEVVRVIILGLIHFWVHSIVLPLGGVENLAENASIEVNC